MDSPGEHDPVDDAQTRHWSPEGAEPTREATQPLPVAEHPSEPSAGSGDGAAGRAAPAPGSRKALVIGSAALLVVVLVAVIVWLVTSTNEKNRENAIRQTATGYVTAVAEADADRALGLLAERPSDTSLLTRPVLEASRQAAPLTEIQVGALASDQGTATVDVSYRLGDLPVSTTLRLTGDGRTAWRIADGTADLAIPEARALTVNGVTPTAGTHPVFPGTYAAAPASDLVALAGEPRVVVPSPDHEGATIAVTPGLSEQGTQTVLAAVKGRFDECLAATESRPANCPFGVSDEGVEVQPGSVRFSSANDPWAWFVPTLDPDTMTATGRFGMQVNATATVTRDGLTTEATTALNAERGYTVDLKQDPPVVTWS